MLHFPRSGKSGRAQKRAFIRQGVEEGFFATTHPHLPKGLDSFNFCAQSRVTINKEKIEEFRQKFLADQREAPTRPQNQIILSLPTEPHFLQLDRPSQRFVRVDSQELRLVDIPDLSKVKVLFVDHHQVLDRDRSNTCSDTGVVSEENIRALRDFRELARSNDRFPYIFILSYIGSSERYESCKGIWNQSHNLHEVIDGIIVTFSPEGEQGKAKVISKFAEQLRNHLPCCLIDDNAEILAELEANLATDRATGVHIKLKKKRSLYPGSTYSYGNWLSDGWTKEAVTAFLAA